MKQKKWLALLLAFVLAAVMTVPAFAEPYAPIINRAIRAVEQQTYRRNIAYENAIKAQQAKIARQNRAYEKAVKDLQRQVAARENAYWQAIIDQANAGKYPTK